MIDELRVIKQKQESMAETTARLQKSKSEQKMRTSLDNIDPREMEIRKRQLLEMKRNSPSFMSQDREAFYKAKENKYPPPPCGYYKSGLKKLGENAPKWSWK